MSLQVVPPRETVGSLRLRPGAVAVPALICHLTPALVVSPRESGPLLAAVAATDVSRGGQLWAGPVGVQLWDSSFAHGSPGAANLLGSVDWTMDAPAKGYVTVLRAVVTDAGVAAGAHPRDLLAYVLSLGGIGLPADRVGEPVAPVQDPFRRNAAAAAALFSEGD